MLRKAYKFTASLKLAVILLLALAFILAAATYFESVYDTKTAQHLVYGSPGFVVFLSVLFVNILAATTIRYPWKRHQFGFVITHLGLLTLLAGSLYTMIAGVEGTMALGEGETSSRITMDQPVFFSGTNQQTWSETAAEFRWNPPAEGRPTRISLPGGFTAIVEKYYHHARQVTDYVADPGSASAALQVRIHNSRVDVSEWLTLASGSLPLGPATLYLSRLRDEAQVQQFLQGKLDLNDRGELQLLLDGQPHRVSVRELAQGQDVPVGAYQLKLLRYLPYAVVSQEKNELVSRSDEPVNPALELEVGDGKGASQRWLLFAKLPNLNTRVSSQGRELAVQALYQFEPPAAKSLSLAVGPQGKVYYKLSSGKTGEVEVKKDIATGWMDLQFEVQQVLAGARKVTECRPVQLSKKAEQEGPPPAILVRLEGAPRPGPYWLTRGDVIQAGDEAHPFVFGYGLRTLDVGVKLKLDKFVMDFDPGTRNAASYKSEVEVDGAQKATIQMNEPLVKNGYKFFQASFAESETGPTISVLSVARDPGITMKYLGSILLVLGIAIMFYMKPYMIKKKKADA